MSDSTLPRVLLRALGPAIAAFTTLACGAGPAATGEPVATPEVATPPASEPAQPAAPTAAPRAAQPPAAPSSEELLKQGACKDPGSIVATRVIPLRGAAQLLEINCENFAYQGSYEFWHQDPSGLEPALGSVGSPLRLLGVPSYDPDQKQLTWLEKSRGVGDCGSWYKYELEGQNFTLREHRERACSAGATVDTLPPPSEWPLVK